MRAVSSPAMAPDLSCRSEGVQVTLLVAGPAVAAILLVDAYRGLIGPSLTQSAVMHAAWLIYSATCWMTVAIVWLWSRRRGIVHEVFAFRRPQGLDWIVALAGTAFGVLAIFPFSQWISQQLFGSGIRGMGFDAHQPGTLAAVILWAIVSAPFCEEVLFRGLAVAYLRARRWPAWAIGVMITAAFAAIHYPYFGMGGVSLIFIWGAMIAVVRLWRNSLTPSWMIHIANNVIAFVLIPLLLR